MGLVTEVKNAVDLAKQITNAELKVELLQKLIGVQETALELQEENQRLKGELKALQNAEETRTRFVVGGCGNAYFRKDDQRQREPFCLGCLDKNGQAIHLFNGLHGWQCSVCQTVYRDVF